MLIKRRIKLPSLPVKLGLSFSLLLIGCNSKVIDSTENTYQPINLAEVKGILIGNDPEALTLDLFGKKETIEGKFSQETKVLKEGGFEKTVILTQLNLPDDSVKGIRYRLKFQFDQSIGKWRLKEVGRQQSCQRSDSSTHWTIEPCP
ncbi:hypothetical protein [Aphanothece sacrum]|nr:hypothetical protein [Aphanothece sacrum]